MAECFASYCRCCECVGKHCLVYHPGHSHRLAPMDLLLTGLPVPDRESAPCPACVSEVGRVVPGCPACGGTGRG